MSDPYASWPPGPGGHGRRGWSWPARRSPAATVALILVAAPVGALVLALAAALAVGAVAVLPFAVPAGALLAVVCRPRRRGSRTRPASPPRRRRPTRKGSPLYLTKKGR